MYDKVKGSLKEVELCNNEEADQQQELKHSRHWQPIQSPIRKSFRH